MTITLPPTDAHPALVPAADLLLRPRRPEKSELAESPQSVQLRHALARLGALRHPNLTPVRSISQEGGRFVLHHSVPAGSVSWSELTSRRRATAGEAATMGLAVGSALAALHDDELAHGALTGHVVLVDPDGGITLGSCGSAWVVAPGQSGRAGVGPSPADDVQALAQLIQDSFDPGTIGAELAVLLIRCSDEDPTLRPAITEVLAVLRNVPADAVDPTSFVVRPAPDESSDLLRRQAADSSASRRSRRAVLPAAGDVAATPSPDAASGDGEWRQVSRFGWLTRGSTRRRFLLTAVVLVGVLLVARVAIAATGHTSATPAPETSPAVVSLAATPPAGTPPVAPVQWASVVSALDVTRAAAMGSGSAAKLADVDDPAGPAYANDLATMRARTTAGLTVVGGRLAIRSVSVLDTTAGRARLEVADVRGAYTLRDAAGRTVLTEPARPLATWRLELVAGPSGWRVFSVVRQ